MSDSIDQTLRNVLRNRPRTLVPLRDALRFWMMSSMANVHFSSASDRWATPTAVYAALDAEFHFDFDPCPLDGNQDGLAPLFTDWRGKRVFCNPPYGPGIGKWIERGLDASIAVFLLPARTDTRWFHELCLPKAIEIRFLRGRLKFGDAINSAPFPSMIVVFKQS